MGKKRVEKVSAVCRRYRSTKGRRAKTRNTHKLKKAYILEILLLIYFLFFAAM